ncbi:hypothetical protein JCM10213_001019 [Rhodosporidiobolus nylandii]
MSDHPRHNRGRAWTPALVEAREPDERAHATRPTHAPDALFEMDQEQQRRRAARNSLALSPESPSDGDLPPVRGPGESFESFYLRQLEWLERQNARRLEQARSEASAAHHHLFPPPFPSPHLVGDDGLATYRGNLASMEQDLRRDLGIAPSVPWPHEEADNAHLNEFLRSQPDMPHPPAPQAPHMGGSGHPAFQVQARSDQSHSSIVRPRGHASTIHFVANEDNAGHPDFRGTRASSRRRRGRDAGQR